jgi:spermidine synthase
VHAESSPYQRIVVTRWRDETRLYLNHNLQFSSRDEYRYHEALVHPGLAALPGARKVLVLGGGDGMAVREILKYPQVESITLVDLDPRMTELFAQSTLLRELNGGALASPKLKIVNADALQWLEQSQEMFDFVVADFPDPSNHSLGKLYSTAFYRLLKQHVAETGLHRGAGHLAAVRAGKLLDRGRHARSRRLADRALPRAGAQLRRMGLHPRRQARLPAAASIPVPTRFVTPDALPALFHFPADMARVAAEPNRLDNQNLVRIFEREWGRVQAH